MNYICIRCGKQFEANRKTAVCKDCHTAVCVVCGKEFDLQTPWTQKTCSSKCRGTYRKESGIAKAVAEKATATVKKKYGVTNISALQKFTKVCKMCGKQFETTSSRQVYCDDIHHGPCPVCGKLVEIKEMYLGPQACSEECRQVRIAQTCIDKYGDKCVLNSEYGHKLAEQTNLRKRGVRHHAQTQDYHVKCARTRYNCIASDGVSLDSKYELDVYEFAQECHLPIQRQLPFPYVYDKPRMLFIDFSIDNMLVECKGGHLIQGIHDENTNAPILTKLRLYKDHGAILVTDKLGFHLIKNSEDGKVRSLVCVDIELFRRDSNKLDTWHKIIDAIDSGVQFIDDEIVIKYNKEP